MASVNRKVARIFQTNAKIYFCVLLIFAAITALYSLPVAGAELLVILFLSYYNRENGRRRRKEISKYLDNVTVGVDSASKNSMTNSPMPMIIFRPESGEIIWTNDRFLQLMGDAQREHLFDTKLSSLIPEFDTRWLQEGKSECPDEVTFQGRRFMVYGQLVRTGGRSGGFMATTYWVDVTEMSRIRENYKKTRPVTAVLLTTKRSSAALPASTANR